MSLAVIETLLDEIFSQLPQVADRNAKLFSVKYDWGFQDDMNLYMTQELGNKTPLIWYMPTEITRNVDEQSTRLKLIIAKDSENKTARNKKVWKDEFKVVLDPLLENVRKALKRSGKTQLLTDTDKVYREANYTEYLRDSSGKVTQTKTLDHWNVIIFECDLTILGDGYCVQEINFY